MNEDNMLMAAIALGLWIGFLIGSLMNFLSGRRR